MGDVVERDGGRTTAVTVLIVVGLGLAVFAATAAGVTRGFDRHRVDRGDELLRVAIAVGIALAVGAVVIALVARSVRQGRASPSLLRGSSLAMFLFGIVALGAIIGAALTPGVPSDSDGTGPPPSSPGSEPTEDRGAVFDPDSGEVFVDSDGNGVFDHRYIPCPDPASAVAAEITVPGPPGSDPVDSVPEYDDGEVVVIPIDENCDGHAERSVIAVVDHGAFPNGPPATTLPPKIADPPSKSSSSWWIITIGLLIVLAGLIAVLVKALRTRPGGVVLPPPLPMPPDDPAASTADVAASFAESAALVADDPDPRRAIIAAYAHLLERLAAAGHPRLPHEAPEEHLRRCLNALRIPADSLSTVTRQFLVARFSTHTLTELDRDQVRDALRTAGELLRVSA